MTVKYIEEMSRDGVEWVRFTERWLLENEHFEFEHFYIIQKLICIAEGYRYWRIKIEPVKEDIENQNSPPKKVHEK